MNVILPAFLAGWAGLAVFMLVLWMFAMSRDNAAWVDFGWGLSLVLLVGWYALALEGEPWRRLFYCILTGLWGLRLTWHMGLRLRDEPGEDPRYQMLREQWAGSARRNFLYFFQLQGLANLLLTLPIILLMSSRRTELAIPDLAGASVIIIAVLGEALADRQLRQWKSEPANRGRTCRRGLWACSRHPNYFFEWLHWVGYPVLGLSLLGSPLAAWWPLTLLGPAMMLLLLLRYTGIPYTEKRALQTRGEDYRKYQREISPFVPWFPKKCPEEPA